MKKYILFTLFLSFAVAFATAQDTDKHERMKALKTAYITQEMKLSSADAQKFWPIYNKFEEQKHTLHQEDRKLKEQMNTSVEEMNEKQADEILSQLQKLYQQEQKIKSELVTELRKQFDASFVVKLKKTENDFRMQLLKKYRNPKNQKD